MSKFLMSLFSCLILGSTCSCSLPVEDDPEGPAEATAAPTRLLGETRPAARIVQPDFGGNHFPTIGPRLHCRWDALDQSDQTADPASRPFGFEFKLILARLVDSDEQIAYDLIWGVNLLLQGGDDPREWIPGGPDLRALDVQLPSLGERAFAVRAIDALGRPEEHLERNRNFVTFVATSEFPYPYLSVRQIGAGHFDFGEFESTWDTDVLPETNVSFRWEVDASHYGAPPGPTNYALDIADPEDDSIVSPTGVGGWIGWARRDGLDVPFVFDRESAGTEHTLYIRVRDGFEDPEAERLVTIRIHVAPIALDRFALIVDDTKFAGYPPTDEEHDAYIDEVVAARLHELGQVDRLDVYGDPEGFHPRAITFEELGHYRVVLWHTHKGANPNNGLRLSQAELAAYMAGGGRVLFVGGRQSGLLLNLFGYPKHPNLGQGGDFGQDSFIWTRLRYQDEVVGVPTEGSNSRREASGIVGCNSLTPGFPSLTLDLTKWDPMVEEEGRYRGGIVHWEGVLDQPPYQYPLVGFEALYSPETFDLSLCCGPIDPGFGEAMIAHRYESPVESGDPDYQGRTVVFNFEPWYFESDGVSEACRSAVDWLVDGLEDPGRSSGSIVEASSRKR